MIFVKILGKMYSIFMFALIGINNFVPFLDGSVISPNTFATLELFMHTKSTHDVFLLYEMFPDS